MADRPDLDEPFSLHPLEGEDVLSELLGDADEDSGDDTDPSEDDES
jgi:hypothetical protein